MIQHLQLNKHWLYDHAVSDESLVNFSLDFLHVHFRFSVKFPTGADWSLRAQDSTGAQVLCVSTTLTTLKYYDLWYCEPLKIMKSLIS